MTDYAQDVMQQRITWLMWQRSPGAWRLCYQRPVPRCEQSSSTVWCPEARNTVWNTVKRQLGKAPTHNDIGRFTTPNSSNKLYLYSDEIIPRHPNTLDNSKMEHTHHLETTDVYKKNSKTELRVVINIFRLAVCVCIFMFVYFVSAILWWIKSCVCEKQGDHSPGTVKSLTNL